MATAEHREPYESRGSRTVLGAPGGEIPPGDSTNLARRLRPRVTGGLLARIASGRRSTNSFANIRIRSTLSAAQRTARSRSLKGLQLQVRSWLRKGRSR